MKPILALPVILLGSSLVSCQGPTGPNTQRGAALGALGGAAVGGIVGNQSGRALEGAAIGAAAGAGTGALIGNAQDQENERARQDYYRRQQAYGY